MTQVLETAPLTSATPPRRLLVHRHAPLTRLTHWVNLACIVVLLMSGLQIFNAHPALYWGQFGADADPAVLEIGANEANDGSLTGYARVGSVTVPTTGVLGASRNADGHVVERAFPRYVTLPGFRDLHLGRRWHFFFAWIFVANLLVYYLGGLASGHLRRDLLPSLSQLKPSSIAKDIWDHLQLKFPHDEEALHYNFLQKMAYLGVIGVLLPAMVLTGLTMSPAMDAILPWLVDLFGGRQSARTIHFIAANLIVLFIFVHVVMVILAGPINELRSMITGKFAIVPGAKHE